MIEIIRQQKISRNKTIDSSIFHGELYLDCIVVNKQINNIKNIINRTIKGDIFYILPLFPQERVDLIIADPPYNLTKSFNENKFSKKSSDEYEEYARAWLSLVYKILKLSGSIYIRCDWVLCLNIGSILGDFFKIKFCITWKGKKGAVKKQIGKTEWKIYGFQQKAISMSYIIKK